MSKNTAISVVLSPEERQELSSLQDWLQTKLIIGKITQVDAIRYAIRQALKTSR